MTHQCQSTSRSVSPSPRPPRPRAPQCGPALRCRGSPECRRPLSSPWRSAGSVADRSRSCVSGVRGELSERARRMRRGGARLGRDGAARDLLRRPARARRGARDRRYRLRPASGRCAGGHSRQADRRPTGRRPTQHTLSSSPAILPAHGNSRAVPRPRASPGRAAAPRQPSYSPVGGPGRTACVLDPPVVWLRGRHPAGPVNVDRRLCGATRQWSTVWPRSRAQAV
jgi:hypothetical protein